MPHPEEYHARPQTSSQIIESKQLSIDIPLPIDADGDWDETFVEVLRVIRATMLTIEGLACPYNPSTPPTAHEIRRLINQHELVADPRAAQGVVEHNYLEALMAAFRCSEALLARDDLEDVKRDFSQLDDETLADVHSTIGYISGYFGIDLDLPEPAGGGS